MNTIENKTKFFAQYWGNDCYAKDISIGYRTLKVGDVLWRHYIKEDYETSLLLKPLSNISNEDLETIVKVLLNKELPQPLKIDRLDDFIIVRYLLRDAEEWQECDKVEQYLTISDNQIKNNIGYIKDNGTGVSDQDLWRGKSIFNKLIELGYTLDWNGMTVEQQLEYGWIKTL